MFLSVAIVPLISTLLDGVFVVRSVPAPSFRKDNDLQHVAGVWEWEAERSFCKAREP